MQYMQDHENATGGCMTN